MQAPTMPEPRPEGALRRLSPREHGLLLALLDAAVTGGGLGGDAETLDEWIALLYALERAGNVWIESPV